MDRHFRIGYIRSFLYPVSGRIGYEFEQMIQTFNKNFFLETLQYVKNKSEIASINVGIFC